MLCIYCASCIIFSHNLRFFFQVQAQSTISNLYGTGLTAGLQTSFPGGADGKAHVRDCFFSNCYSFYGTLMNSWREFLISCDCCDSLHTSHSYNSVIFCKQITYLHDYAALHAKIHGFKAAPDLELSANLGNKRIFTGGSLMYNTESRNIFMTKAGMLSEATIELKSFVAHFHLRPYIWFNFFNQVMKETILSSVVSIVITEIRTMLMVICFVLCRIWLYYWWVHFVFGFRPPHWEEFRSLLHTFSFSKMSSGHSHQSLVWERAYLC